jgi:hypothetical protein
MASGGFLRVLTAGVLSLGINLLISRVNRGVEHQDLHWLGLECYEDQTACKNPARCLWPCTEDWLQLFRGAGEGVDRVHSHRRAGIPQHGLKLQLEHVGAKEWHSDLHEAACRAWRNFFDLYKPPLA